MNIYACIGIGNTGTDASRRCVNRLEFNEGGFGWPQLLENRILPTIALLRPQDTLAIGNPGGEVPGLQQAEAFAEARRAGLPLLGDTAAFTKAIAAAKALHPRVTVYMGGVGNSSYIMGGGSFHERLRRAKECYQPILDAGAGLTLDGDAALANGSNAADIVDALDVFHPDPSQPQIVEAVWGARSSWNWNRPCNVLETTYQRWRLDWKLYGRRAPTPEDTVIRRVDTGDVNSMAWMMTEGRLWAARVAADGHHGWVNADCFADTGTTIARWLAPEVT